MNQKMTSNQAREWTPQQNLEQASLLKQVGNKHFSSKQYKQALKAYHKAILHLSGIIDRTSSVSAYSKNVASEQVAARSGELKFSIYMNMAQIYLFQNKWDRGLEVLAKAASIKCTAKLFYRRGVCNMRLFKLEQARQDFSKVLDLDPTIKDQIQRLTKQLKGLQKKQDQKSKSLFQKFFK